MRRNWITLCMVSVFCTATLLLSACGGPSSTSTEVVEATNEISVLIVGGGSSHDFDKWYREVEVATLGKDSLITASYIDDVSQISSFLSNIDVLYLATNQPITDSATRAGIFDFVAAGKGLVLGHAGLWYNWEDWPEYNHTLVSGGSRGHDAYGAFDVTIQDKLHPVTQGVPETFNLKDELYYFKTDSTGPGIEVLATANRAGSDDVFPSVFVVKNPNARIVGLALGHDAESHELQAYQSLLINAIHWVSNK